MILAPRTEFADWLDPTSPVQRLLDLVHRPHGGPYERRPINPLVNTVWNNTRENRRFWPK